MGWGLVDLITGEPVGCGMEAIDLPDHGWSSKWVARALEAPCHVFWYGDINPVQLTTEIQAVYIEQPWLSPKSGTKSAYSAGRAVQATHGEVERRWPWAPVEYLQPAEWRALCGLKGNASKIEVYEHAAAVGGRLIMADGVCQTQDAADALCIAVAGQIRNGENWDRGAARDGEVA